MSSRSPSNIPGIRFEEPPSPPPIPDHELIRCIGRGSYGEVWLARNVMGTYRAVKIVHRRRFQDDRPFEREFAGLQRFEPVSRAHDSQVDILHIGRADDWFYYVMELADDEMTGPAIDPDHYRPRTLRAAHEGHLQYTAEETLEIGLALTTALEHLHGHELIHRDIKPSNVIFVNGIPKLADIGLVSSLDATRSFVGTEGFVPPEGPGAPTGDIYSLGKVLYELCTGRDRKDYPELPTALAESLDRERLLELNAIIAKACRENPKDRYPAAAAMREDLLLMQSGKSVRRMRHVERRLRQVRRVATVTVAVALLSAAAFWFQTTQTRQARELAGENLRLVQASRDQLVRMQVDNGNRYIEEGDYSKALLWFVEALELVEGIPDREDAHRLRLDSLLRHTPRVVRLFRHEAGVTRLAFSLDGKRLVTASKDLTARVWDLASGDPVTPPLPHDDVVWSIVFSPDGQWVLTASADKTARIWDAATGAPVMPPLSHKGSVVNASFHPDGTKILCVTENGSAHIWDAHNGRLLASVRHDARPVHSAAWSPDGQYFLTRNSGGPVTIWDALTCELAFPPIDAGPYVNLAVFSPDGTRLLTGTGRRRRIPEDLGTARVWNVRTGEPVTPAIVHEQPVILGGFSPDGTRFVTASNQKGGTGRIWNAATGEQVGEDLAVIGSGVQGVVFSPDGARVATWGEKRAARIWDADSGLALTPPLMHTSYVLSAAFSPDGYYLATANEDGLVRV